MENGDHSRRNGPIRPPFVPTPISCHRRKRWRRHGNGRYSSSLGLHVWTSISFRITHVLAAAHPSWAFQTAANRWNPLISTTRLPANQNRSLYQRGCHRPVGLRDIITLVNEGGREWKTSKGGGWKGGWSSILKLTLWESRAAFGPSTWDSKLGWLTG